MDIVSSPLFVTGSFNTSDPDGFNIRTSSSSNSSPCTNEDGGIAPHSAKSK